VTRALARVLARYAAHGLPRPGPSAERLILGELDRISGDAEALVWALGCAWEIKVERGIRRHQPSVNLALLAGGLYITGHFLLMHLSWYGIPPSLPPAGIDESRRGLVRLGIYLGLIIFLTWVLSGRHSRRVFGAVMFPFLAFSSLAAYAAAVHVTNMIAFAGLDPALNILLRGPMSGVAAALLLSLPCVLLYRQLATPVAVLSLIPAIARETWLAPDLFAGVQLSSGLFRYSWFLICFVIYTAVISRQLRRWLRSLPKVDTDPLDV
jgi:hypothetical protein